MGIAYIDININLVFKTILFPPSKEKVKEWIDLSSWSQLLLSREQLERRAKFVKRSVVGCRSIPKAPRLSTQLVEPFSCSFKITVSCQGHRRLTPNSTSKEALPLPPKCRWFKA